MGKRGKSNSWAGFVLWLRPKREISPSLLEGVQIPKGAFGHPVLVLHQQQNTVSILVITSLNWHMPNTFKSNTQMERITAMHVPIAPSPRHRETRLQLKLCHNMQLPYRSYVIIDRQYDISIDALDWWPSAYSIELRLQAKSLSTIRNQVHRFQSTYSAPETASTVQGLQQCNPLATEDATLNKEESEDEKLARELWEISFLVDGSIATNTPFQE